MGDIITVLGSILTVVYSVSGLCPNWQIIQTSFILANDYFIYYQNIKKKKDCLMLFAHKEKLSKVKLYLIIKFMYPHDNTKKIILENFNLTLEQGKKMPIVGELGCRKSATNNLIEWIYDNI